MGKMKLRPLGDRVIIEPLEAEDKTKGGIILPDTAKEKPQEGKIIAAGKGKLDENGKIIFTPKLNKDGKKVLDQNGKMITVPEKEILTEKDGEWLFVVQTNPIPLLGKEDVIRAHYKYCSDMGERVWIKSPNLVPIGDYFYPTQQWQEDITRIKTQHQAETLIETYEEFLDLLAHVTQMSLGSDPNFQKIMLAQSEAIGTRSSGVMVRNE